MKVKYIGKSDHYKTYTNKMKRLNLRELTGYASIIKIEEVNQPLIIGGTRLIDDGYTVISFLPEDAHWCLQAFYNDFGETIEWYFDMTLKNAIDELGNPYYVDLYLDFIILPDGKMIILDEDELQEALTQNEITQADFDLAHKTLKELMDKFSDTSIVASFCAELRQLLKEK